MNSFKDFCEEQLKYTYIPLETTTNLYTDILNDFIEEYEGFLNTEDIELLKNEVKKDTTTFESFLEQFSSYVSDYHMKIRPEDFDYRLESTPIEKLTEDEQMFLYNYSDVYESISNINKIISDTRILFDFSSITKFT